MFYIKQTYYHLILPTFLLGSNVLSQLSPPFILLLGSNLIMKFPGHPQTACLPADWNGRFLQGPLPMILLQLQTALSTGCFWKQITREY
jgi:hypothetical protein